MVIEIKKTQRGFAIGEFRDLYQEPCSIQESSLENPACIWLGIDIMRGTSSRMHLTQEQVEDLLPLLKHFAKTGSLPGEDEAPAEPVAAEILAENLAKAKQEIARLRAMVFSVETIMDTFSIGDQYRPLRKEQDYKNMTQDILDCCRQLNGEPSTKT